MRILPVIALMLILGVVFAHADIAYADTPKGHVQVIQPIRGTFEEGGTIDFGVVGPGQKIEIEIARSSNIYDFNNVEEIWDRLVIEDDTLPLLWKPEYSLKYEANPKAFVTVYRGADEQSYTFQMHTQRDYGIAANYPVKFDAKVLVSKYVVGLKVLSKEVSSGTGQPAVFTLGITNKGAANDAFEIEVVSGLPERWSYKKQVYVPHNSAKEVRYEVIASEQVDSEITFRVTSLSSISSGASEEKKIFAEDTATLHTRSGLLQDMKSVGSGVILFPYIEQAVYYLLGFVANNLMG
ncbi:MAG: hypothetical protein ABIG96_05465 [Candidatus Micrarchaeota archaeon]